jgi:hypothetical protein
VFGFTVPVASAATTLAAEVQVREGLGFGVGWAVLSTGERNGATGVDSWGGVGGREWGGVIRPRRGMLLYSADIAESLPGGELWVSALR